MIKRGLAAVAFCLMPLTAAKATDLLDLLKEGYEIKAISVLPMRSELDPYQSRLELVLQKGDQAALCEAMERPWGYTHSTGCDLFHKYGDPQKH